MPTSMTAGERRRALAVLFAVYACYQLDKNIVAVLLEPIKADLGLSDSEAGVLAGLAYAAAFIVTGPIVGWILDRFCRAKVLAGLLFAWSLLTMACALSTSHLQLLLARMGVGAAESGAAPAALSMIADLDPPRKRSSSIGVLYFASAIGVALSFLIGSFVAAHWGWRQAFLIAGGPGVILAALMAFAVREPVRGATDAEPAPERQGPLSAALRPSILSAVAGVAVAALVATSLVVWSTSFLVRSFGFDLKQAGLTVAMIAAAGQGFGAVIGGQFASWYAKDETWKLGVPPAVCLTLSVPCAWLMVSATSAPAAIGLLLATVLLVGTFLGPAYAMLLGLAPAGRRSFVSAVNQCAGQFIGFGLGPVLTGWLSDVFGGAHSLRPALGLTVSLNVLGAAAFLLAARLAWLEKRRAA